MNTEKIKASRIMIFAIVACLLYLIGRTFIGSLISFTGISEPWFYSIAEGIVIALTVIMILIRRSESPEYGIQKGAYKGSLKYMLPLTFLALMLIPYFFLIPVIEPLPAAILHIIYVGVMEEFIFRGLVFRAVEIITDENKAIIISSILFGLFHLVNLSGDDPVWYVVLQVAFTAAIGLGFAVLRAKTGSIFACMIIHAVLDINALFEDSILWMEIIQISLFFVVGIVLYVIYRKETSKREQIPAG
jgi:hypothetical protein